MEQSNALSKIDSVGGGDEGEIDDEPEEEQREDVHSSMRQSAVKKEPMFSLTLLAAESGDIAIPPKTTEAVVAPREPTPPKKSSLFGWMKRKEPPKASKEPEKSELLPCPRILQLCDSYYCIYNDCVIDVYKYNSQNKADTDRKRKKFQKIEGLTMKSSIVFVKGWKSILFGGIVLVGMAHAFELLFVNFSTQAIENKMRVADPAAEIMGGGFDGDDVLIFTREKFRRYRLEQGSEPKLAEEHSFPLPVKDCKFIEVLKGEKDNFFFIFSERKMVKYVVESEIRLSEKDSSEQSAVMRAGEAFHIVELYREDQTYRCEHYDIAKIPEEGMFNISKVFYLGNYTFLISLHEEIVVIRKQYKRYIIVDNICITANRLTEESKKGQLVLIDMQKIIYNEIEKIYVYSFAYDRDNDKLKTELVDNFKGVDESQIILYDGIMLRSSKDTTTQVLFYFNMKKIRRPGRAVATPGDPMEYAEKEEDKNKIKFSVYGIVQLKPLDRLKELLQAGRPQNEINEFKARFKVSSIGFYMTQWIVSAKSLNDIINNLLEINNEDFIKKQLDDVLRKSTHTMSFLISIEEKQIVRLKLALTARINNLDSTDDTITEYIKRLLESKMFLKKLKYQNEFEAYKEVDFIDIKKLRETSLKEEIKLLSCKGFERRLKNFLNDFKFLAIANFEQIFDFLMANKEDEDIEKFLVSFNFIIPETREKSIVSVFVMAAQNIKKRSDTGQSCRLWADKEPNSPQSLALALFGSTDPEKPKNVVTERPETIDTFIADILPQNESKSVEELKVKTDRLRRLLLSLTQDSWFKDGAFKQHCMLVITEQELEREFAELKQHKVYDILFRYLYRKLNKPATLKRLQGIITMLVEDGRISPSYRGNVSIREAIFDIVRRIDASQLAGKPLEQFIILSEPEYFKFLIDITPAMKVSNGEHFLLTTVKEAYQTTIGCRGFFEERFNVYLKSSIINLDTLKLLLEAFERLGRDYQRNNHMIMTILLESITRNLKICETESTEEFLAIIMNVDLIEPNPEVCRKVAEGCFFGEFFRLFELDYTYEEFIEETKRTDGSRFLSEIISKYCRREREYDHFEFKERVDGLATQPKMISISDPLEFFKFVVYMLEEVEFMIEVTMVVEMFLLAMFDQCRYEEVRRIIDGLFELVDNRDPKDFFQELVLKHVDRVYTSTNDMEVVYENVREALLLVEPITIRIKKKQAFVELSLEITRLEKDVLSRFDIHRELGNKPMVFLVHLLESYDPKQIRQCENRELQRQFGTIYEKMTEATSLDINFRADSRSSNEFKEFEVERGYYCLKKNWIAHAIDVCCEFATDTGEDDVYYHDLVYSIGCCLCQKFTQQTEEDACSIFLQFLITNNDFVKPDNELRVTQVLRQASCLDKEGQLKYMRSLEKELKATPRKNIAIERPFSIADELLFKLVHVILDMKVPKASSPYYITFMHLINEVAVEAFYFLMKTREISISSIVNTVESLKDRSKEEFISQYFSLAIYIRSLADVVPSFYPTYSFFMYKKAHLADDKTRRDINILAEKLRLKEEQAKGNNHCEKISDILMKYYSLYMKELSKEAVVSLTALDLDDTLDTEGGLGTKIVQANNEELRIRKELLGNQAKFDSLVANISTRVHVPDSKPPPIKLTPLPEIAVLPEMQPPELPSEKYEKYEEVKKRSLDQLNKIGEQHMREVKAETNNEIDKIIEKFRMEKLQKAQSRKEPSEAGSSRVYRSERDFAEVPHLDFEGTREMQHDGSRVRFPKKIERMEPRQKAEKPYEEHRRPGQLTQREMSDGKILVADGESAASNSIGMLRRKMEQTQQRLAHTASSKQSVTDLKDFLTKSGETNILLYVNKAELVRDNATLLAEFVKKMFESARSFAAFLRTLEVLIKTQENIALMFQLRAVKIAGQAIRIESKLDPKKLFDIRFFQDPMPNLQQKQFEEVAFDRLRENILQLVDDQNVHSLAKMMLYGLGLDKKYEHLVYLLFLEGRLEEYLLRGGDEKAVGVLIERIKSVFVKLPRESRCDRIRELLVKKGAINRSRMAELTSKYEEALNRTMKLRNSMVSPDDLELLQTMKTLY